MHSESPGPGPSGKSTETPRMCEFWEGQAARAAGLGRSGTHFPGGILSLPCLSVSSLWVFSGALVSAGQPLCLYLCVCVCTHIHVTWLSVWARWAPAYCFVRGVVGVMCLWRSDQSVALCVYICVCISVYHCLPRSVCM